MTEIFKKILEIKKRNYFLKPDWESRGLSSSSDKVIEKMRSIITLYLNELLKLNRKEKNITNHHVSQLIIKIENGDYTQLDTEEREWCSDIFLEIAEEVGFNPIEIIKSISSNNLT